MSVSKLLRYDLDQFNDEGHPVCQGEAGWANYYCGLKRPHIPIERTDGRCGPTNGNNCPSCKRFTHAEGIDSDSDGQDGYYDYGDSGPQISWGDGANPSISITHNGHTIEQERVTRVRDTDTRPQKIDFMSKYTRPRKIDFMSKYPHLYSGSRAFPWLCGQRWQPRIGGDFVIESVYTKLLYDVDVDVFSEACRIMTVPIRGHLADKCLAAYKNMVRHYFKSNIGEDGFEGLVPGGRVDCLKLMTCDYKACNSTHLAVKVGSAVMLVNIEFDRSVEDSANMCDGPGGMDDLFSMLNGCGVFSSKLSEAVLR
jgi:hypothetical protein